LLLSPLQAIEIEQALAQPKTCKCREIAEPYEKAIVCKTTSSTRQRLQPVASLKHLETDYKNSTKFSNHV
jgi:hypothetical protein